MTSTKSDTGIILEQIYERLDIPTALAELEPKRSGGAYALNCPQCGKKHRAYTYEGYPYITCNRKNECGYHKSLWDYVAERDNLTEKRDVLRALAELAGYELPTLAPEALETIKRQEAYQSKLEAAQAIFTARLFSKEGTLELQYLEQRGYTKDDIIAMGLGSVPAKSALTDQLKDKIADQDANVPALNVAGFGDTHTLSIPFRNRRGQLIGWSVRAILPGVEPKYKYSVGMKTGDELFNLNQCRGLTNLVLVEGPIDALIATVRGIPGVVACGRNKPTEKQLNGLKELGVMSVTLALDKDEAGKQGTIETIYALADRNISSFVLDYPGEIKDLDEGIRERGAGTFIDLIASAQYGYNYIIETLHEKYTEQGPISDRNQFALTNELMELDTRLNNNMASSAIIKYLSERLELPPEMIKQTVIDNRNSRLETERQKGYQSLQTKTSQLVKAGEYDKLEEVYTAELPKLRSKNIGSILEPYNTDYLITDLQRRHEGYTTGFRELDEQALIPAEAITVVAGRPSHGKTTVMLNMLYNLLTDVKYMHQSFYFFSYEETKSQLAIKLLTIMAGVEVDQYRNTAAIENYFKTGQLDESNLPPNITGSFARKKLDQAKAEFDHLANTGRLWLVDEPLEAPDLAAAIDEATRTRNVGVVFIDYMQKIRSNYGQGTRQAEIQKISGELLDCAKRSGVAIVTGAQLNRKAEGPDAKKVSLAELRESGDIEQDAHLVLSLFNHARADFDVDQTFTNGKSKVETQIEIKVLKNRSGVVNGNTALTFKGPILKLTSSKSVDNYQREV